ncbi:MAG: elongation factor P [Patescibacteria group bacterium]
MAPLDSLNSIKVGAYILFNNEPYQVMTANFVRMQQRQPVMQTKLKNLITGKVVEYSFKAGERLEEPDLEKRKADYLYTDPSGVYFMDTSDFDQFTISTDMLGNRALLLKEGTQVDVVYFNGNPISISLPPKIDLKVTSAPPAIKGDTAGNVTKQVELETGLSIATPLFIKEGDTIRINTETVSYVERV